MSLRATWGSNGAASNRENRGPIGQLSAAIAPGRGVATICVPARLAARVTLVRSPARLEVKSIRLGGGDEPVRHLLLLDDLGDFAGGIVLVVGLEVGRPADRRL